MNGFAQAATLLNGFGLAAADPNGWEHAATYDALVRGVSANAWLSLRLCLPELLLTLTAVLLLGLRVVRLGHGPVAGRAAVVGAGLAAAVALFDRNAGATLRDGTELFTGMLILDRLTLFFRLLLVGFTFLFVLLCRATAVPDDEDAPEIFSLVFASAVGLCVMVSANHLAMVFLGMELATVPLYVLAGLQKGGRRGSEAALKFAVFGAAAAGTFLYGMTLLAGTLGSAHLPTMAVRWADWLGTAGGAERHWVLLLGGLLTLAGLAFKLSAVPLHFWTPDVYDGATAEVGAFLSVASKAAALGLLMRLTLAVGGASMTPETVSSEAVAVVAPSPSLPAAPDRPEVSAQPNRFAKLQPLREALAGLLGLLAAVTATFGNLAAFGQTRIKRLLAYSTIAHAGYLLMPIAAAAALLGRDRVAAEAALAGALAYVAVYMFLNLGSFALVAFLRNRMQSEEIASYAGLIRVAPGATICFCLLLVGLIGLPPSAGFLAKFTIFASLADAGMWSLLLIGLGNTVVSLFYYVNLIRTMTLDPPAPERLPVELPLAFSPGGWYVLLATAPTLVWFFRWDGLAGASLQAVAGLCGGM